MTERCGSNDDGSSEQTLADDGLQDDEMQSGQWKRHGFSDFLTKTGVSAALADAVLEMCRAEQRPSDPIEFVRTRMRPNNEDVAAIEAYRAEIEGLQSKVDWLREERDRLLERKRKIQTVHVEGLMCEDHINIIDDEEIL